MNTRKLFFKGRLAVASIAVVLALGVTALKRDDSRRRAADKAGTNFTEIRTTPSDGGKLLKGEAAYGDWREDAPGVRRLI
ncbi:MAG: hypothetical protein WB723_06630, partial [Candidatus Acidiferrales bacterium]